MKSIRAKNSQKHLYGQPDMFSLLTSTKFPVPAIVFEWTLTKLRFNMIENLLHCMFSFYFPLFMVLLLVCVIFKSVWYLRAAFWVLLHAMFIYVWKQAAQRLKLRERLLTINKINIIQWNMYRDNNFHSRSQVLRVKCFWKSWVK